METKTRLTYLTLHHLDRYTKEVVNMRGFYIDDGKPIIYSLDCTINGNPGEINAVLVPSGRYSGLGHQCYNNSVYEISIEWKDDEGFHRIVKHENIISGVNNVKQLEIKINDDDNISRVTSLPYHFVLTIRSQQNESINS